MKAVIIGGGPVGALAAQLLAQYGLQVSMIHRPHKSQFKAGETLPPIANNLFKQLNIFDLLQQGPHLVCPGNQSAFGSRQLMDVDFIFSNHGQGWHLDRNFFEQQLLERAKQHHVNIIDDAKLTQIHFEHDRWFLVLQNDRRKYYLEADYLIDATGISRVLLRQQAVRIQHHDQLAARIMVLQAGNKQQDQRTLIEATEHGWWYSTAAPHNIRIVMYFSDTDLTTFQACNKQDLFISELQKTKYVFNKIKQDCHIDSINNPLHFGTESARTSQANNIQGHKWCAIGDAAMTFDPLSSQGLTTGLQSALQACNSIIKTMEQNHPCQHYSHWNKKTFNHYLYERQQYYAIEKSWPESEFWQRRTCQQYASTQTAV